jgi:hypothetical protein
MYYDHYCIKYTISRVKLVKSDIDQQYYQVHTDHRNLHHAADMMATVNAKLVQLQKYLTQKYLRSGYPGVNYKGFEIAQRLSTMYSFKNLVENSPHNASGNTSYTIGKGDVIALCIREKSDAAYMHEVHTVTFVAIHELAHIATKLLHHPDGFWVVFRFLLTECENAGIYRSTDYSRYPQIYCGMRIDYNPMFDATIEPIPT